MVLLYWALAYIVGSAIPQVQTISGLVAAICIMQFTYTFPPLFILGYNMVLDASGPDDPGDSWSNWSRWKRGIFGGPHGMKGIAWKAFNFVLFLGAAAMACLGEFIASYFGGKTLIFFCRRNVRLRDVDQEHICERCGGDEFRVRVARWLNAPRTVHFFGQADYDFLIYLTMYLQRVCL